jgi:hypothetical protein
MNRVTFDRYKREFYIDDSYNLFTQIFNDMMLNSANIYNDQQQLNNPNMDQNDALKQYTAKLHHVEFMINKCVEEEKYEFAAELKVLHEELKKVVDNLNKKYE